MTKSSYSKADDALIISGGTSGRAFADIAAILGGTPEQCMRRWNKIAKPADREARNLVLRQVRDGQEVMAIMVMATGAPIREVAEAVGMCERTCYRVWRKLATKEQKKARFKITRQRQHDQQGHFKQNTPPIPAGQAPVSSPERVKHKAASGEGADTTAVVSTRQCGQQARPCFEDEEIDIILCKGAVRQSLTKWQTAGQMR